MTKWLLLLLMPLVSAPAVLAQSSDYSRYEFYGGYAYQRVNKTVARSGSVNVIVQGDIAFNIDSRDENFHGFTGEFNQNLNRHWGIVTSFTGVYDKTPFLVGPVQEHLNATRYDLLFGPRYNFRLGRLIPFVEGMAGFEHLRVKVSDVISNSEATDTRFAMAVGGGVDVHLSHHFDIRAIQGDYVPTFFNGTHQNNYRVGAGVKVKFVDP